MRSEYYNIEWVVRAIANTSGFSFDNVTNYVLDSYDNLIISIANPDGTTRTDELSLSDIAAELDWDYNRMVWTTRNGEPTLRV